jgi:4-diphosphocytidyl-2-C-methyl-D-erythritol kinase
VSLQLLSYAKLNLSLEVLGRRDDGFHNIRSIVQTVNLADRIHLSPADHVSVDCSAIVEGVNLAERAARALLDWKRSYRGGRIQIEKRIPMGAGLGGGSSNAAAVLAGIDRLLPPPIPPEALDVVAAQLGSDVPLFLAGGCQRIEGTGRPVQQLSLRSETYVVLVPPIHCSTAEIYRAWSPSPRAETSHAPMWGRNDLYAAAVRVVPALERYADAMARRGGIYSNMTGSGSAFYAAFTSDGEAVHAREVLKRDHPECQAFVCHPTNAGLTIESEEESA